MTHLRRVAINTPVVNFQDYFHPQLQLINVLNSMDFSHRPMQPRLFITSNPHYLLRHQQHCSGRAPGESIDQLNVSCGTGIVAIPGTNLPPQNFIPEGGNGVTL